MAPEFFKWAFVSVFRWLYRLGAALAFVFSMRWLRPVDASLAIERAVRDTADETARLVAPFKAFRSRALGHTRYRGGHFDAMLC